MKLNFRYGGKRGRSYGLQTSKRMLVLRSRNYHLPLNEKLSANARRTLDRFNAVLDIPHAGTQLFSASNVNDAFVNRARLLLAKETSLRFSGAALCDPKTKSPVIYTENAFIRFHQGVAESRCKELLAEYSGSRISGPSGPSWTQLGHAAFAPKVSNARYTLDRQRLSDAKHSIGHLEVWPIKHISPPIITLGNRSGRSDKSKPKNRFKDHVCGPAIRPTVEWETRRLTKVRSSKSLRSLHLGTNSVSIIF